MLTTEIEEKIILIIREWFYGLHGVHLTDLACEPEHEVIESLNKLTSTRLHNTYCSSQSNGFWHYPCNPKDIITERINNNHAVYIGSVDFIIEKLAMHDLSWKAVESFVYGQHFRRCLFVKLSLFLQRSDIELLRRKIQL